MSTLEVGTLDTLKKLVDGNQKSVFNSPVEFGSLSHDSQGFSTIPGGKLAGLLNHQQYQHKWEDIYTVGSCLDPVDIGHEN